MKREDIIKLLESIRESNHKIIEFVKNDDPKLAEHLLSEACTLSTVVSMLEDDDFAKRMWEIQFNEEYAK